MRRFLMMMVAIAVLAVMPDAALGQTHPCDETAVDTGRLIAGKPVNMTMCQVPTDTEAVTVYTNGTPSNLAAFERITTAVNSKGQAQFGFLLGTFQPGLYTLTVATWGKDDDGNAIESPQSGPFVLTSAAPRPPIVAPEKFQLRTR